MLIHIDKALSWHSKSEEGKPCTIGHNAARDHCIPDDGKRNDNRSGKQPSDKGDKKSVTPLDISNDRAYRKNFENAIVALGNKLKPKRPITINKDGAIDADYLQIAAIRKHLVKQISSSIKTPNDRIAEFLEAVNGGDDDDSDYGEKYENGEAVAATLIDVWASASNGGKLARSVQLSVAKMMGLENYYMVDDATNGEADQFLSEFSDVIDDYVSAVYNNTQTQLKEIGVNEMTVYRGMGKKT